MAANIPALWSDPETTAIDRKEIVRCLVEQVVVTVQPDNEYTAVAIHWHGGAVSDHTVVRPLGQYEQLRDYPRLIAAVRQWHEEGCRPQEIADRLNEAGFRTPRKQQAFKRSQVHELLHRIGLTCGWALTGTTRERRMVLEQLSGPSRCQASDTATMGCPHVGPRPLVEAATVLDSLGRSGRAKAVAGVASAVKVGSNGYPPELTTPRLNRADSKLSQRTTKAKATG